MTRRRGRRSATTPPARRVAICASVRAAKESPTSVAEPVEHRGYVPPRSVVVPGTRPKEFPAGTYHLSCALIIGRRTESTDLKTSLNDALREYGIGT